MTTINRETRETRVRVAIGGDPATNGGGTSIQTSVPFLDHMLGTLARYAGIALSVEASGDLRHHIIEDVAVSLGQAVARFAPAAAARYGDRTIPMDDALVQCALDLGGRPYYRGPLPSKLYDHWMRSFADNAGATLHLRVLRGRDRHHVVEAAFKALGLSLRDALRQTDEAFSTKGAVHVTADT
jgi:imidazoleglycerol-phosphate dehydratase